MPENDIIKLEAEIERLKKLVFYDELTQVLNRRGFHEEGGRAFSTLTYGRPDIPHLDEVHFALMFLDIDNFKPVNDAHGHDIGDIVLKEVAHTLVETLRTSDIIARWGGEEFVVALLGTDAETALMVANRVRENIQKIKIEGKDLLVTASIGIATYETQKSLDEIIKQADQAMYHAKQTGKNRVIVFHPSLVS